MSIHKTVNEPLTEIFCVFLKHPLTGLLSSSQDKNPQSSLHIANKNVDKVRVSKVNPISIAYHLTLILVYFTA